VEETTDAEEVETDALVTAEAAEDEGLIAELALPRAETTLALLAVLSTDEIVAN